LAYLSFARGINIGGSDPQFATFINADNDAINCPARRFTRSRKIFHEFLFRLLPDRGLSRAKQKR